MNKCKGCGVILQNKNKLEDGYINSLENNLCERCFKIINYGDYKMTCIDPADFKSMLNHINETKSLVILVIDLFNFNPNLEMFDILNNDVLLVLTKRDLLPKSIYDEKLINYLKTKLNIVDKMIISSNKNYNFDLLLDKINKYKTNKDVYVVGYTNAGKSSLINRLMKNYLLDVSYITTSILPNTTLNKITIKFNDFNIIDTPGILDKGSIYYLLNGKELKKIIPKKEIKPVTYQIKYKQYILIDKYAKIDIENNNVTIFMGNVKIKRLYKNIDTDLIKHTIEMDKDEDLVLSGLGFIKFTKRETITIYTLNGLKIYKRKSLI